MSDAREAWYEIVFKEENLLQGDLIKMCPVIIPPENITIQDIKSGELKKVKIKVYEKVIILTQSCDLFKMKSESLIIVSPLWKLSDLENKYFHFKSTDKKNQLRQGNMPGYHLLDECNLEEFDEGFLVVDFRTVHSITFETLKKLIDSQEKRLRLLPPYREHLSQAFAKFFMRVGLPSPIASFKSKKK